MSSWLIPAENQAANTEIKSKTAARIVQEFMKTHWDYADVTNASIGWGYHGSLLGTRSGKSTTLQCIPVINMVRKETTVRNVMRMDESVRIDIYQRDETVTAALAAPPRLAGMVRYVEGFIEANMNALYVKGISGMELVSSQFLPADPNDPNSKVHHAIVTIHVWYRMINEHPASV